MKTFLILTLDQSNKKNVIIMKKLSYHSVQSWPLHCLPWQKNVDIAKTNEGITKDLPDPRCPLSKPINVIL